MVTTEPNFEKIHRRKRRENQHLLFHMRMRTVAENLRLSFEVRAES